MHMVTLYVAGEPVGTLADAAALIPGFLAKNQPVELRNPTGKVVGTFTPAPPEPLVPWDATITQADIDRIAAEPGFTFEEVKKRLGWE